MASLFTRLYSVRDSILESKDPSNSVQMLHSSISSDVPMSLLQISKK